MSRILWQRVILVTLLGVSSGVYIFEPKNFVEYDRKAKEVKKKKEESL